MKRFWLGAIFFCMVCLCYAQQNEPVLHEETETVESPAADKTAEISEAVEENSGNTERKHADESQNTGMDTKPVQDAAEKNAEPAAPAKPKKESFFKNGRTAFALGIEASGALANSYSPLPNLFRFVTSGFDYANINWKQLSDSAPKNGISFAAAANAKGYLDIYIRQKYEFGFYTGMSAYGFASVPKTFFGIVADISKGKIPGGTAKEKLSANLLACTDIGAFYGMSIKSFKFRVNASYYMPLFYLDPNLGSYTLDSTSAVAKLHIRAYTPINLDNASGIAGNVLKGGGVDIDFIGSYTFNPYVNLQFSVLHIPIVPAVMNKGISIVAGIDTENHVLDFAGPDYSDLPPKKVFRPLKINTGVDVYPFANNYLIISPSIGFHCLSPFYVDAGVKLESRFLKVLGVYYAMAREDLIWKNRVGFFIDTRIIRLETFASSAGTTFVSAFKLRGAEAGIKLVFGY